MSSDGSLHFLQLALQRSVYHPVADNLPPSRPESTGRPFRKIHLFAGDGASRSVRRFRSSAVSGTAERIFASAILRSSCDERMYSLMISSNTSPRPRSTTTPKNCSTTGCTLSLKIASTLLFSFHAPATGAAKARNSASAASVRPIAVSSVLNFFQHAGIFGNRQQSRRVFLTSSVSLRNYRPTCCLSNLSMQSLISLRFISASSFSRSIVRNRGRHLDDVFAQFTHQLIAFFRQLTLRQRFCCSICSRTASNCA